VGALARRNPSSTAFIDRYRARARAEGRDGRVAWTWTPYAAISPNLKRAVLVAEDIGFFSHRGFEPAELRNAVERALENQELPRGASTITQQLAKNLWLSPSRDPVRKVKEALLTWQLERRLSKRRILELYLNVAEWGPGIFGAEEAARAYISRSAASLPLGQAAALAATLPHPLTSNPARSPGRMLWRQALILDRLNPASGIPPAPLPLPDPELDIPEVDLDPFGLWPPVAPVDPAQDTLAPPPTGVAPPPQDSVSAPPQDTLGAPR
jgi:monofunctional biosynthetic peptidoglycan transglycosylase